MFLNLKLGRIWNQSTRNIVENRSRDLYQQNLDNMRTEGREGTAVRCSANL
jgi:hypothetical protein